MSQEPSENDPLNKFTDPLICKLWSICQKPASPFILTKQEIRNIILQSKSIIAAQPVVLELNPPLIIVGDIHGQFFDLLRIFRTCGDPSKTNYLFLGDYVDRGPQSINVICLLLLYKIRYPFNFFILRGNHESFLLNREYGFYSECKANYDIAIWKWFNDLFDWFPLSAIINGRILCVHGGISPNLKNINQLYQINRPCQIPDSGLICDIVWSDPNQNCDNFDENDRGKSYVYGYKSVQALLEHSSIELIARAHQAIFPGYDFPFSPYRNVVTIFSAANYRGEYGNFGAVMTVSAHMICKFIIFEPKTEKELIEMLHPNKNEKGDSSPSLHPQPSYESSILIQQP